MSLSCIIICWVHGINYRAQVHVKLSTRPGWSPVYHIATLHPRLVPNSLPCPQAISEGDAHARAALSAGQPNCQIELGAGHGTTFIELQSIP